MIDIQVFRKFRCHVLIPHDIVGTIIDSVPTFHGLEVVETEHGCVYLRKNKPILEEIHQGKSVKIKAHTNIWIQEPGLVVKIAGNGSWRGIGLNGKYSSEPYSLENAKDAHIKTVHFSRVRTNREEWTKAIEYRQGNEVLHFHSNGKFDSLIRNFRATPHAVHEASKGCEVFGRGYFVENVWPIPVAGQYIKPPENLLRWELAGKLPNLGQMYFLGWTGGPAAVVNLVGRDVGAPGDKYVYNPFSWRQLRASYSIEQTLWSEKIAA